MVSVLQIRGQKGSNLLKITELIRRRAGIQTLHWMLEPMLSWQSSP